MPIVFLITIALGLLAIVLVIAVAVGFAMLTGKSDHQPPSETELQQPSENPFQSPMVAETARELSPQSTRTRIGLEDFFLPLGVLVGSALLGAGARAIRPYADLNGVHYEALASLFLICGTWIALAIYHRRDFGVRGHVLFQLENFALWAGFVAGSTLVAGQFWGDLVLILGIWGVGAAMLGSLLLAILHWRFWKEVPYKV